MSSELDWAIALKKSKHQQKIPLTTQKANLIEQLELKKKELKQALTTKNTADVQSIYDKLIALKTKLLVCEIGLAKENYLTITEKNVLKIINKHIAECQKLAQALNAKLSN